MAITPAAGWMVDPNNPNGVVPIGSQASVNNPNTKLITPSQAPTTPVQPVASSGIITRTSTASTPAPTSTVTQPTPTPSQNTSTPSPAPTTIDATYFIQPGETSDQYTARIAAYNASKNATPTTPTTPTATDTTSTNADATHSGLLQSQANTAATNPLNDPSNPLVANLKSAQDAYSSFQQQIAAQNKALETGDQALPVVLGQEGAMQKQYAAKLDALQTAVNTAQTALGQAVNAYSAQTSAQNAATSQTQPGNAYTQVSPANTLVGANGQPITQSGSGSLMSPLTGQPFTSTGNPQGDSAVSGALQMIKNGAGYSNAVSAMNLGLYGTKALSSLQSGLPAGFNPNADDAKAAANAKNIGTVGTTPTDTAATGYASSQQAYIGASTAYTTAQLQAKNVQDILAKSGINSSNSQDWNTVVNKLSTRLGSANQTAYIAGLAELKQTYTNLLASVGAATPTVNGQQATDIFSPASTPSQIAAAVSALDNAAYAKLAPLYQQYQTYQAQLGGSGGSTTSSSFNW